MKAKIRKSIDFVLASLNVDSERIYEIEVRMLRTDDLQMRQLRLRFNYITICL